MRCVWYSYAACLVFVFFLGRLAVPRVRHGFEARRVFFCPLGVGVLGEKGGQEDDGLWRRR